jgi:hypothetical protein
VVKQKAFTLAYFFMDRVHNGMGVYASFLSV